MAASAQGTPISQQTGAITMPLVGEVPVKGMTRAQVEAELTRRLGSGFVRNPSVSVEVYDFRTFSILGEVQRPGNYPAREGTTLTAAIAVAGGYTYRANERRLLLRRANGQSYYSVDADANVEIRPGDTAVTPYSTGTWGSRSMVMSGGAVATACEVIAERVKAILASRKEKPAVGLKVGVSTQGCSGKSYTLDYAEEIGPHESRSSGDEEDVANSVMLFLVAFTNFNYWVELTG